MTERIYHITTRAAWQAAQAHGQYIAPSLATEGFIHFSRANQVTGVANAFYAGQNGLVLLEVDVARLSADLRWEPPAHPGGVAPQVQPHADDLFPHLYGPLNLDAVRAVRLYPQPHRAFPLPAWLTGLIFITHSFCFIPTR